MIDFSTIFRNESLKSIFIYFTDPIPLDGKNDQSVVQYNKRCRLCGEKKAEQCAQKAYSDLKKECNYFEIFLDKQDKK